MVAGKLKQTAMEELVSAGCQRILMIPLYPQYAASTTASACDALFDALRNLRLGIVAADQRSDAKVSFRIK